MSIRTIVMLAIQGALPTRLDESAWYGYRLLIDGQERFAAWPEVGASQSQTVTLNLDAAKEYKIRLEFSIRSEYRWWMYADVHLKWSGPGVSEQIIPAAWFTSASPYDAVNVTRCVYDGWNLLAELALNPQLSTLNVQSTYAWGMDLGGSLQDAGGVGGLLFSTLSGQPGTYAYAFDGNGNVAGLIDMASGNKVASYDYNPFGELLVSEGPSAAANAFRFSTKYADDETGQVYYGYRYYQPASGRWPSRDPSEEENGVNLYGMVANDPINAIDPFGLWATGVHHKIVDDWLGTKYDNYQWCCCKLDVRALIKHGSDKVDGVFSNGWPSYGWLAAQSSARANQHGMSKPGQSVADSKASYDTFILWNEEVARILSDRARSSNDCASVKNALVYLGQAFHSFTDEQSPAHEGFQTWYGPIDGLVAMGPKKYYEFIKQHEAKETEADYERVQGQVVDAVRAKFQERLGAILRSNCGAK